MYRIKRFLLKFSTKFILPFLILVVCIVAFVRAGESGNRITDDKDKLKNIAEKLEAKKMEAFELRRKLVIMEMPDFKEAIRKSNLGQPPNGESRIRVK